MSEIKITSGLEDYIEVISNYLHKFGKVRAVDISRELNVSRASVSEALNRLSEQGFINYGRYGAISITPKGISAADSVIKRHTILHNFLCGILGLDELEASENACKIEHVISDNMLTRLNNFLEYCDKNPEFIKNFKS